VASAAASCPVTVKIEGSTTVFPANQLAEGPFETLWAPGTDVVLNSTGSGTGLNALRADTIDVAASSRPLTTTELTELYAFEIGGDAMVLAVNDTPAMNFITNITVAQVEGIWEGSITNWSALGGSSQAIVPRARIIDSGTRPDFLRLFSVNDALEQTVIGNTGLPRLVESSDMADAAAANDYQIVYTSLANAARNDLKALTLNGIFPTIITVQDGTYPAKRQLYLAVHKTNDGPPRIDNSNLVRGDDFVNYMLTAAGQAHVAAAGFVKVAVPSSKPIPDFDINLDRSVSLPDLGAITGKWAQSSTCKGRIRADANNDGTVSLPDLGQVTSKWGGAGFAPPN